MIRAASTLALFFMLSLMAACSDDNGSNAPESTDRPTANILSYSRSEAGNTSDGNTAGSSSITYSYNAQDHTLLLRHRNAAFNDCPGSLDVDVNIEENIISLVEKESDAGCNSSRLYDLEIGISNLPQKPWVIVIVEPYLTTPDLPLSLSVDLTRTSSGEQSVPRSMYPWVL